MKKITALLLILSTFIFFSCKSKEKTTDNNNNNSEISPKTDTIITFKDYKVITLFGVTNLIKNPTMSIDYSKKTISGNSGCNQYGGDFTVKGNNINFGDIIATRMYCEKTRHIEILMFKALANATFYKIDTSKFILFDKNNTVLLISERQLKN